MRKQQIDIYKFDELNKDVQEKVLNRFRENNDMPFLDESLNDRLNELLTENEIHSQNLKLNYLLNYSQGDGCCFIGTFQYQTYRVTITHKFNYYHKRSTDIDIRHYETDEEATQEVFDTFKALYYSICDNIEKFGYVIIEDENCETTIKQNINDNEYEFYADGRIYND